MRSKVKYARKYAKMFSSSMKEINQRQWKSLYQTYYDLYLAHLNSQEFTEYSRYKTISLEKVYAAITHAQICLELGYNLREAQWIWETVFCRKIKKAINRSMLLIDALPNGYKITAGWLYKDAQARIEENCLTYDQLDYTGEKLEYKITRCAYVEIFNQLWNSQFCQGIL